MRRLVRVGRRAAPEPAAGALDPASLGWSLLLAAEVLAEVQRGKSLNEALVRLTKEPAVARVAAQDVVYGVLRGFGRGEFIISRLMDKPLGHPSTQALLRAALYRLETRPDSRPMVVDQAVRASGEMAGGVFKGLVNGVLRNYLRQRETLLEAMKADDAAWYGHPEWWLSRLRRTYPEQWPEIVAAGNEAPPMCLRTNVRRISVPDYHEKLRAVGIIGHPVGIQGVVLDKPVAVERLPDFHAGLVSVQDAGAQRAAEMLSLRPGDRVLDACAAPGGKTAHLLEREAIDLLALDVDAVRTDRIRENLDRLGLVATIRTADCRQTAAWWDGRPFDAILADVPCSASGVVRRHPDIKHLRRESDIRQFARTQGEILDALWPVLKPGGQLLYVTCSVFAEENTGQIDAFMVRQPGVIRAFEAQSLPGSRNDGFYYALLRKNA